MNETLFTPQEVADLLKIKKTTVYDMIKKGTISAVKMGKQFRISETSIQSLLGLQNGNAPIEVQTPHLEENWNEYSANVYNNAKYIVCGQDILLDMLCAAVNSQLGRNCFLRSYAGSFDGLIALYNDEISIASAHLWDMESDSYNLPFIRTLLPGTDVSIYHVMKRSVCIYTSEKNPKHITSIKDLGREDISIVNREKGSGIRVLTDSLIKKEGISTEKINGYGRIVNSHLAAASIVARGGADCAVGTENASYQFKNLERIFLKNEQYDIVIKKSDENIPEIKALIQMLRSEKFKEEVSMVGTYDITDMGMEVL